MLSKTLTLACSLLVGALLVQDALHYAIDVDTPGQELPDSWSARSGGVMTLFQHDPLRRTMSFATGTVGPVVQEHEARNWTSDIDFGCYAPGEFTVGIEGGRRGVLLDLGSAEDLEARYGFSETVGTVQGFTSIPEDRGALYIRGPKKGPEYQQLRDLAEFLGEIDGSSNQAAVTLGHTYLARIVDVHDESFERIVKFKVIAHTPGQSATLRWVRLRG